MKKGIIAGAFALTMLFTDITASAYVLKVISADEECVYENADINSERVIGTLRKGKNVSIIDTCGNRNKIGYENKTAYINVTNIITDEEEIENNNKQNLGTLVTEYAKNYLGVPYVYGGTSPSGFDCSGFVQYVYSHFGINLPRVTYSQVNCGEVVRTEDLQVGDLLFFRGAGHVGIYVGEGMYIHAPQTGRNISIDPIKRSIYAARRVI